MPEVLMTISNKSVSNRKQVKEVFQSLPDGRYLLKIERKDRRSNQQNRYLHGIMLPVVRDALRDAGWNMIKTIEDAKDFIKVKFLRYDFVNEQTGEVIEMFRNTSSLTRAQFSEMVQDVQTWLLFYLNVELPLPGEQSKMF